MGFRAIRYCLRNPGIFLDQLRAILRVSAFGKVKIMFPMISGVGELIRAKEFLFTAKRQLSEQGVNFDENIKIGCMIETTSAVTICDMLADEVDFFSVGLSLHPLQGNGWDEVVKVEWMQSAFRSWLVFFILMVGPSLRCHYRRVHRHIKWVASAHSCQPVSGSLF